MTCNIPKELHKALQELSAQSKMKIGTYVRHVLTKAVSPKAKWAIHFPVTSSCFEEVPPSGQ